MAFHPIYYSNSRFEDGYDIALLRLKSPQNIFAPAHIADPAPPNRLYYPEGTQLTTIGFGSTEFVSSRYNYDLRYTTTTIGGWNLDPCPKWCTSLNLSNPCEMNSMQCQIASQQGDYGRSGTCPGDSGGPSLLTNSDKILSVTSYSEAVSCGSPNKTWTMYTQVPHFQDQINEIIAKYGSQENITGPTAPWPSAKISWLSRIEAEWYQPPNPTDPDYIAFPVSIFSFSSMHYQPRPLIESTSVCIAVWP